MLGGKLGETLGNLIQQGLGQGGLGQGGLGQRGSGKPAEPAAAAARPARPSSTRARRIRPAPAQRPSQGRSLAHPASPVPSIPPAPAPPSETMPDGAQDSPAMNDVLRQLFNR